MVNIIYYNIFLNIILYSCIIIHGTHNLILCLLRRSKNLEYVKLTLWLTYKYEIINLRIFIKENNLTVIVSTRATYIKNSIQIKQTIFISENHSTFTGGSKFL